jgi:glycerol uptake facilitator-like aquaporin
VGELIGEVFGCFLLILLGDGVVANVGLAPRLAAEGYDWVTITLGWAFAVVVAVYVTAGVSGAHLNPAVTLALALKRDFPMGKVLPYWIAQIVGCFLVRWACSCATEMAWLQLACPMCGVRDPEVSCPPPTGASGRKLLARSTRW